ncbi:carboxypeptidase B-like isoform X2 [Danaus plexippus]|uniref:carboxypeptidase B-like isoform X2 n=1 Tax=Danaus plexippus TaxID=13037 RepID=UPI0013C4EFD9|nr:carboxypeptidase B-like isoform X2 [Danaus plexippus]
MAKNFSGSSVLNDDYYIDTDSSEEKDKAENGTQTRFLKCGKGKSSKITFKYIGKGIGQIAPKEKPKRKQLLVMDWKKFHRLSVIYSFLDHLEKDFPAICTVSVIGKSVEGRDIKMLKISNSNASNAAVWLDAAIHSREWISTAVVTYLADFIARNFQDLSNSVTNKDWYIVPVLNPDGYEYTHTRDRMWRKNRARRDGACVGVDLNRNFSCGWGNNGEEGSSDNPNSVFYRGPEPFSEPESSAVRDTILSSATAFKVFLSFHSYFELIIFPWGYKTDPCPHYLDLLEGASIMARVTTPFMKAAE